MIDLDRLAPLFLLVVVAALVVALGLGYALPIGSSLLRDAMLLGGRP